ncbi:glutamate racemase [Cellulosilyticum sp. I15G10I2]|uniref:glutamate racemase n=1 Tax=Cellulosilyticum sp. I15G10I2 TaxID=1892843 RepID=UPI00085C8C44|nr:glutamate racemase [Cellulosilyticum sp. I15G10I2]
MDSRPIGIFDSGVGGLTVVKEVMHSLVGESVVYFGDTARVPYGSKSKQTVTKFSAQIIRFLLTQDVKAIIIACNTVSSNSIEELRDMFPNIPIVEVVGPGVHMALHTTKTGVIGVVGTQATIASNKYPELLLAQDAALKVYGKACPLFVPLVEDGWADHDVAYQVVKEYLKPLLEKNIDSLILGCTHYPMLTHTIKEIVGTQVELINPAEEAAKQMGDILSKNNMSSNSINPEYKFYVSDSEEQFKKMAQIFLNKPIEHIATVPIEEY